MKESEGSKRHIALGYSRVNSPRQVGEEGIEDPDVVKAYDRISRWPQFKMIRRMIVSELRKYHPTGTLVDIGCGPGYLLAVIAKTFPQLHVVGVDIAEEMLEVAAHNLTSLVTDGQVALRQGDVQQLPFDDNSVDFVVSTLSLHHWANPTEAMYEIHRVLKPQGQFLIFDLRRDARRFFYWLLRFAQTFVLPRVLTRANEPTSSALSSYTPYELQTIIGELPLKQSNVKPGLAWIFIWGCKDRPHYTESGEE